MDSKEYVLNGKVVGKIMYDGENFSFDLSVGRKYLQNFPKSIKVFAKTKPGDLKISRAVTIHGKKLIRNDNLIGIDANKIIVNLNRGRKLEIGF